MKWKLRNEKGQNLVEMALVMMLLLLLLAGAVDVGRAFHDYIIITNAAREGARMGARLPCTGSNQAAIASVIKNTAVAEATNSGISLSADDVVFSPACVTTPQTIAVTVTHSFQPILTSILMEDSFTLSSNTKMLALGNDLNN